MALHHWKRDLALHHQKGKCQISKAELGTAPLEVAKSGCGTRSCTIRRESKLNQWTGHCTIGKDNAKDGKKYEWPGLPGRRYLAKPGDTLDVHVRSVSLLQDWDSTRPSHGIVSLSEAEQFSRLRFPAFDVDRLKLSKSTELTIGDTCITFRQMYRPSQTPLRMTWHLSFR